VTALSARCTARARPIAAHVHHRPPGPSGIPPPCSRRRDSRTASRPPPRPRRGTRIPARSAPWIVSERVDVSAAHARSGRSTVVTDDDVHTSANAPAEASVSHSSVDTLGARPQRAREARAPRRLLARETATLAPRRRLRSVVDPRAQATDDRVERGAGRASWGHAESASVYRGWARQTLAGQREWLPGLRQPWGGGWRSSVGWESSHDRVVRFGCGWSTPLDDDPCRLPRRAPLGTRISPP
jgi:hypothetical protein